MDETEAYRRERVAELNAAKSDREILEEQYGQVYNTQEMSEAFEVMGFMAPFVIVRRKSDGVKGSLEFQHNPRYYFNFLAD